MGKDYGYCGVYGRKNRVMCMLYGMYGMYGTCMVWILYGVWYGIVYDMIHVW